MASPYRVQKLSRPADCLIESERLWQLTVGKWLVDTRNITRLPHVFTVINIHYSIYFTLTKVFDDMLIAGQKEALDNFSAK